MKFWAVAGPLWLMALAAFSRAWRLPSSVDLYFHDSYVILAKAHVVLAVLLFLVLPLSVATWRHYSRP